MVMIMVVTVADGNKFVGVLNISMNEVDAGF